jgi:hypothetical protein
MRNKMREIVEMLAITQVQKDYGKISSVIFWGLYNRHVFKGRTDITVWELWISLLEEAKWIRETRF